MTEIWKTILTQFAIGCILTSLILGSTGCTKDSPVGDGSEAKNAATEKNDPGDAAPTDTKPADVSTDGYPAQLVSALEQAAKKDQIVMVELHDPTCKTCKDMDRAVFAKEAVKAVLSEMIHVKIGPDDRRVIDKFGLSVIPSFLFFKANGEQLPPMLEGYRPSKRLAKELENFKLLAAGQPAVDLGPGRHPQFGKG